METISLNGRFLGQPLTGVQRFARELTAALDRRIGRAEVPPALRGALWRLVVPEGVAVDLPLGHIQVVARGRSKGHLWEQTALARETRRDLLVGFGGSGPLLHPRQLTVIHDATIFRHPASFGRGYRAVHALLGFVLTRTARIATVSRFSRGELAAIFWVPEERIAVIYNATDHFADLRPDDTVIDRLGLRQREFFLLVGTLKPNKNIDFAIRAFQDLDLGDRKLVIVGGVHANVFQASTLGTGENLVFAGRLSDAEVAALERRALAFVFPSLYEGFGIPPLEAMTQGCPVLASDIPPVREACGEAALYFDPHDPQDLQAALLRVIASPEERAALVAKGIANVTRFSWDRSAEAVMSCLAEMQASAHRQG